MSENLSGRPDDPTPIGHHSPYRDEPTEGVKAVQDTEFWRRRILRVLATGGMLHQVILDDSYELWQYIQYETAGHLRRHIEPGSKVLDAGCGYGALCCCFKMTNLEVDYLGVDISPELIEMASYRYPEQKFRVGDISKLPFPKGTFDWVVFRSVGNMITTQCGEETWARMHAELCRVGARLMRLEYPHGTFDQPVFCTVEDSYRVR